MASSAPLFLSLYIIFIPLSAAASHSSPSSAWTTSAAAENSTLFALLDFKASIVYPLGSKLSAWSTSSHFCTWRGIICASASHRVAKLLLNSEGLNGTLSPQIANLEDLSHLSLSDNLLFGRLPSSLGRLKRLEYLDLSVNQFSGPLPSTYGQMTGLRHLNLSLNSFSGQLPSSFKQMKRLEYLDLSKNGLLGTLPSSLAQLESLRYLNLRQNQLSGPLPSYPVQMDHLQDLDLSQNRMSGRVPPSLKQLKNLVNLDLSKNRLSGPLPLSLGQMQSLQSLDLSQNQLSGHLPTSIGQLEFLSYLDLSENRLSGPLPPSLGQMMRLQYLDSSQNQLSGHLPSSLRQILHLHSLNLRNNQLSGSFPSFIGQMEMLYSLDLSYNQLSGRLPMSLDSLLHLGFLNVSYNKLEGLIPPNIYHRFDSTSFLGNSGLHASFPSTSLAPLSFPIHNDHAKRNSLLYIAFLVGPTSLLAFFCVWKYCSKRRDVGSNFLAHHYKAWTIDQMRVATNNFDVANVIGLGAVSMCYLGMMQSEKGIRAMAFKRLIVADYDVEDDEARKSFVNEFKTICKLRHRNVVKVLGYCVEQGELALVMEYMEGGDLDQWLHNEAKKLSWEERVNVALDVAEGLVYLHHEYDQPIIHCDIKPKNILLRLDMVAKISDFGLAKLMGVNETGDMSMSKLRGSFGYIAPEYGMGLRISPKVDVYSFGMLLLELVTGVRPTSSMLENEAMSLRTWVKTPHASRYVRKVLQNHDNATLHEANKLLGLGLWCTHDIAKERPTMYIVRDFILQLKTRRLQNEPSLLLLETITA